MVLSKQTARQSTGGKAPRWDLTQLAAQQIRGGSAVPILNQI
jgi:hypothetical protein